jgi:hypothetical protein
VIKYHHDELIMNFDDGDDMTISTVKLIIDRALIQPITSDDEYEELKDFYLNHYKKIMKK